MNDAKLERLKDIRRKEKQVQELRREKTRMNRRRAELREKGAPKGMLTRYDLEIMELTEQINLKNEELYKLKNGW